MEAKGWTLSVLLYYSVPPVLRLQAGCYLRTASSSSVYVCEVSAGGAESSSQHPHLHFWSLLGRVWANGLLRCNSSKPLNSFLFFYHKLHLNSCGPRMSLSLVPPAVLFLWKKIPGKQPYVQRQRTRLDLRWPRSPWTVAVWGTTPQFNLDDL